MASRTLTQFQTAVLRTVGNVPTSHPLISDGEHTRAINEAANRLIRMVGRPYLFPEKHTISATSAATVVGNSTIAIPTGVILIDKVTASESSSSPTWANITEVPVHQTTTHRIAVLNKDSTTTGYPKQWARSGTNLLYHPTTRTGYTTYLRVYGVSEETGLVNGSDTFTLDDQWDHAVVFLAASTIAELMGWHERSLELEESAKKRIAEVIGFTSDDPAFIVESEIMPSRDGVYGGIG